MSWSWSHTPEAYANAQANVQAQNKEWLEIVYAEWESQVPHDQGLDGFDNSKYNRAKRKAKKLPADVLAEYIWEKMSEQAVCDNGGHNAHCCPYGCGCHTVPFNLVQEGTDENHT